MGKLVVLGMEHTWYSILCSVIEDNLWDGKVDVFVCSDSYTFRPGEPGGDGVDDLDNRTRDTRLCALVFAKVL